VQTGELGRTILKIVNRGVVSLLCGASLTALGATAAQSQDAETAAPTTGPISTPPSSDPATPEAGQPGSGIAEIVVTARKVNENVQRVPIPVSALSAASLAAGRPLDAESISNVVPNVKVFKTVNNSNAYSFYIRGIGRDNNYFNVEAPVALYVDDVIYPYQVGPVLDVGGIDRIEILRGPQGTLYGRNATSGAVKYVTKRPNFSEVGGEASIGVGSYGRFDALAGMTGPLVNDVLAARIDVGVHRYGGFERDLTTGKNLGGTRSFGARGSLEWKPTDTLDIFASMDGLHARDEVQVPTSVIGGLSQTAPQPVPRFGSPYTVQSHPNMPQVNDLDVLGGTIQATFDLDAVVLKSISSYRGFTQDFANDVVGRSDVAYSGSLSHTRDRTFTQEFQATGTILSDRLKYVAGLFYLKSDTLNTTLSPSAAGTPFYTTDQHTKSFAAYLDGTFSITDQLHLTGGIRYTKDTKEALQSRKATAGVVFDALRGNAKWSAVTPRVGVDFQLTPDILLFASYGKGFKGGSLSSLTPTQVSAAGRFVDPEKAQNEEVGIKTSWFDRRLILNANYFWISYQDQTTAIFAPPPNQTNTLLVTNDAKYHGLEVEAIARPVPAWNIRAAAGLLHGEYTNFAAIPTIVGLIDKTPKHVPKFTLNVSTDYTFESLPLIAGSLTIGAVYNYITKTYECLGHQSVCVQEPYSLVDAHVTYTTPDGRFDIIAAGTNVTDKAYFKVASSLGARYYSPPAEYSLTLRARF
jgi:iron complex outermembrane receptor protein